MKRFILLYIVLLFQYSVNAENSPVISLTKVSPEGGVAITSVMSINEDNLGFIWFGTNNGLFKYNSNEIKRYSYSQSDVNSLPSNRINQILNDVNGQLLIATENGICRYNPINDNFHRISVKDKLDQPVGTDIIALIQSKDKSYWILDEVGIAKLDSNFKNAEYINIENNTSRARLLYKDNYGNLWVVFNDGQIYYKKAETSFFQYFGKGVSGYPRAFYADNKNVWVGYDQNGLLCLDISGKQLYHYNQQNNFLNEKVRSIIKTDEGEIWVATYNGVAIINGLDVIKIINPESDQQLPHHSVWSLYKDSRNIIWIGTWLGGLCYYSEYKNSVSHVAATSKQKNNNHYIVTSFAQDPDGIQIWIGTESGSLSRYNPIDKKNDVLEVWYNDKKVENIRTLAFDNKERMWVGTRDDGVLFREKNEKNFTRLKTPFQSGLQIFSLLPVENGIWISDYQQGVFYYSFNNKSFKQYQHNPLDINSISDKHVRQIIQDRKGNIWFATQNGLNLLLKDSESFIRFFHSDRNPSSLSEDYINSIKEDNEGNIWIGTNGSGLDKLNPLTQNFEHFTKNEGLPGNDIFTILEDVNSNLWLATDNGICKFNPKSNAVLTIGNIDGISNNKFNPNAGLNSENGKMFFGGSNGFIYFMPNEIIIRNTIEPKAIITNLYINNKEILPGQNNGILTTNISNTKNIRLSYNQNSFSFRFVANNYINPDKNRFKYRLVGFYESWTETDINGPGIFTNVPSGKYRFEVKASNNDGVWNDTPTVIFINIIPPIWARWYAYLFYSIIALTIILYLRTETINRQKLKNQFELEKVKRESEEKLNQVKLQFFTNISHEFRTPLTLILGPVNRLIIKFEKETTVYNQLNLIKNNSERLLRLINQIMDFRKIDAGKLKLNPVSSDIISFSRNVFNCFIEHAVQRQFEYNFNSEYESLKIDFDAEKLDKIIFNILSNAFKYCDDGGKIELSIRNNPKTQLTTLEGSEFIIGNPILNNFVEISISDTGKGILEENLPKIFERFYQLNNTSMQGSGIGLALTRDYINLHNGSLKVISVIEKGTLMSILLPHEQPETLQDNYSEPTYLNEKSTEKELVEIDEKIDTKEKQFHDSLILIVEDNLELLNYLGSLLGNNFKISKARNGTEGIEQVHSLFPDLIVSDVMMPGMDGIEFCETIKNDIRTSHIPLVLLTALETVKDRIEGLSSGADAYISKPFDDTLLIAQINNLLESRILLRKSFVKTDDVWEKHTTTLDIDKKLILKAMQVVESNLSNFDFTVEMLADDLHLSRTTLHRKLKSLTDQSATEFIRYIRLKHAIKLLQNGKCKVNEVGFAVGFNSHNYFTTSFKNYYGMSPSEFIRKNSLNNSDIV
jgi:signal transduction histidine kinase/ligand-binding sensor domain-containing protein/CheY-like chemotaxis protein/AraC-like DNA-binding protein